MSSAGPPWAHCIPESCRGSRQCVRMTDACQDHVLACGLEGKGGGGGGWRISEEQCQGRDMGKWKGGRATFKKELSDLNASVDDTAAIVSQVQHILLSALGGQVGDCSRQVLLGAACEGSQLQMPHLEQSCLIVGHRPVEKASVTCPTWSMHALLFVTCRRQMHRSHADRLPLSRFLNMSSAMGTV